MKKLYTLLAALLPLLVNAQTITQSDLPTAGLAWTNALDTLYTDAIQPAGTGQTWDLTAGLSPDTYDTVGFINASGTLYSSFFSSSNLAAFDPTQNTYTYFTTNSNGFYVNGFVSDLGSVFTFSPGQLYVPVPLSVGTTRNTTSRLAVDTVVSGTNIRFARTTQSAFNADGSGTLILPTGSFSNVLRLKITELAYDTIYTVFAGFPVAVSNSVSQTTTFRYLKPGFQPSLIATIYADSLGQFATSAEYYNDLFNSISSVQEQSVVVYPSPADKSISFTAAEYSEATLSIMDQSGRIVLSDRMNGLQLSVETASLAEGMYYYQLTGKTSVSKGKFMVRH